MQVISFSQKLKTVQTYCQPWITTEMPPMGRCSSCTSAGLFPGTTGTTGSLGCRAPVLSSASRLFPGAEMPPAQQFLGTSPIRGDEGQEE